MSEFSILLIALFSLAVHFYVCERQRTREISRLSEDSEAMFAMLVDAERDLKAADALLLQHNNRLIKLETKIDGSAD